MNPYRRTLNADHQQLSQYSGLLRIPGIGSWQSLLEPLESFLQLVAITEKRSASECLAST